METNSDIKLDKHFKNFNEYLKVTHGGARVISHRELTSEAKYVGSLRDEHLVHHVFHTNYCGVMQFVEFIEARKAG